MRVTGSISVAPQKVSSPMKLRLYSLILLVSVLLTGCVIDQAALLTLQGRNQAALGHLEQAILWYDQAITLDPTLAEALYGRAQVYISHEEYDQAIADLDRVITLQPEWDEAYTGRLVAHLLAGNPDQAYMDFEEVVKRSVEVSSPYELRAWMCDWWGLDQALRDGTIDLAQLRGGVANILSNDPQARLAGATDAIAADPTQTEAYYCRGNSYGLIGEYEKALADFEKLVELNPDDGEAYFCRVLAYLSISANTAEMDESTVLADLDKAIELAPDFALPYGVRGAFHMSSPLTYPLAIADFETFLSLAGDPSPYADMRVDIEQFLEQTKLEYSSMLSASAENLLQRGRIESAIAGFDQAIAVNPNNANAYNGRAMAYSALGDNERAFADLTQAITLSPENARLYYNRGLAYEALEQPEAAISDYDEAIALEPNDTDFYNARGAAYAEMGEFERAIGDFNRAIELAPENPNPYLNRGKAMLQMGEYERAIADLDRAIELQPDWVTTYLNRGKAYGALGEYEQAIQDLEEYLRRNPDASDRAEVEALLVGYKSQQ